jgi:pimeloyl-ACP methyl ester carboxylesterase
MALNLICESAGSGPPLVILHGLFGSSGNWRGIARELAGTHSVFSVDLRNHGASPWADSMDYVEMADDVLQLIERLGLDRPTVMGHSMGGKTAMALALRHPRRVGRLIVVDIAPVPYADTLTPFAEAMRSVDVVAAASRAEVQRRLQLSVADRGVVPFLMQNLVTRNDHFDWRLNLMGISAAMPQLCTFPSALLGARFTGPLKVIAGAGSDYVAQRDGASFRPMFSDIEIEVIDNAGHWVHADQPAAFLASVRASLQEDPQPATAAQMH